MGVINPVGFASGPDIYPTENSVTISWIDSNSQGGDGQAGIGPAGYPANEFANDGTSGVTIHSVTIPDPNSTDPPLTPGTPYAGFVRSSNSGNIVASAQIDFYTQSSVTGAKLDRPHAEPARVPPGGSTTTLNAIVQSLGNPVPGAYITFAVSAGDDASVAQMGSSNFGSSASATTDGIGLAQATLKSGSTKGVVHIQVSSPNCSQSVTIPVPVEGN